MSENSPAEPSRSLRRFLLGLVVVALGFNLWSLTRYWNENLRDSYEFRQYQTALTALFFQKGGLRLDYETPVLGPPWSVPLEFPLYQAIVAKLSSAVGLPLEQAGRLTSILAFFACFPAIWILLKKRVPDSDDRLVVVATALLCPLFLFYSRTFLIESTALCVSLWFLVAFEAALERPASWRLLAAWFLGSLAAAVKITTFAVICFPALAIAAAMAWQRHRAGIAWSRAVIQPLVAAAVIASVPLIAGAGWTVYSDHLKELNPYGRILTSSSLRTFTLGTLSQRFSWGFWRVIGYQTFCHVITLPALVVMIAGIFVVGVPYRRLALACVVCYCGGFLMFANLYFVHDYYFYASAFLLVTAFGAVAAGLLRSPRVSRPFAIVLLTAVLASEAVAFTQSYHGFYRRPNLPPPALAEVIRAATGPDDVFAAFDLDWNSMLPYYAERRAIMVFQSHTENYETFEKSLVQLRPNTVAAMVVAAPHRTSPAFLLSQFKRLNLEPNPIATTEEADLYLRRDLFAGAAKKFGTRKFTQVAMNVPAATPRTELPGTHDLTKGDWPERLTMIHPAPQLSRGTFELGIVDLEGKKVVSMQTPAEILLKPPAHAQRILVRCGMIPSSYQNGNTTDGVVVEIREERPDGTVQTLFKKSLRPLADVNDRKELVIDYHHDTPFQGNLSFGAYPGPSGSTAFDWVYWRSIEVR